MGKLGKLEGLFECLENVEAAESKNCTELNLVNKKTKVIQNNLEEIEKGIVFANCQIEGLQKKDDENARRIKELEDKLLYHEVYSRRENIRFFGIPEAMQGHENTAEVLYKFFRDELNIPDPSNIEFQRVHRLGKKIARPITTNHRLLFKVPRTRAYFQERNRVGRSGRHRC